MNLKKLAGVLAAILALDVLSLSALEVNKSELESAGNVDAVVFRNYSGPHSVINTIEEIRAIGTGLGKTVKSSDMGKVIRSGSSDRYAVIHAVDPSTKEKLDADIFIIGKNATVDHITNLRRIIAAYLSAAYGYSDRDASTIATFVTVYNAVYRGNMDVFASKYKKIVTDNISAGKVGISTNYEEWPGNTQLIIPLYDLNGGLSTIETSVISDKQVIKSLQEDEDKSLEARKDMVDIKEREAENADEKVKAVQKEADVANSNLKENQKKSAEANKAAQTAQTNADNAKKKAEADKAKADNAKKKADAAQTKADSAKKKADENPSDKNAQKQADKAKSDADKAKAEADKAKTDADKSQAEADKAKSEAEKKQTAADEQNKKTEEAAKTAEEANKKAEEQQSAADKKRSEAQEERTQIAKDQQALIEEQKANESAPVMYGLKNIDDLGVTCALVKINTDTGSVIKESPVSVIRGRTVYEDGNVFIAVAGSNIGKGAVRLIAIDKESLDMAAESKETLSEFSALAMRNGSYYCVIQDGKNFYVGKFNNKVEGQSKSVVPVKAATPITVTDKGVLVTGKDGTPVLLDANDLSQKK